MQEQPFFKAGRFSGTSRVLPELNSALRTADDDIAFALWHPDFLPAVRTAKDPVCLFVSKSREKLSEIIPGLGTEIQELVILFPSCPYISGIHAENAVKKEEHADQVHDIVRED